MIEELKKIIENLYKRLKDNESTIEQEIQRRNILENRVAKLEEEKEKSEKAKRKNILIMTGLIRNKKN